MRTLVITVAFLLFVAACGDANSETDSRIDELEKTISDLQVEQTTTTITTVLSTTSEVPVPTTEPPLELSPAALLWCSRHPYYVLQAASFLGMITDAEFRDMELSASIAFSMLDDYDMFTDETRFPSRPLDWYDYEAASTRLTNDLAASEVGAEGPAYDEACSVAFEAR